MSDSKEIPVRVALRARPLVQKEVCDGCQNSLQFVPNEPQVIIGRDKAFTFDYVFPCDSRQEELYKYAVADRIDCLFKGYNVTVLAYGQTGSGKTYTMGTAYSSSSSDSEANIGVIQRAVQDIFNGIHARAAEYEFLVKVSFLEVYKEDVYDLLLKNKDSPISIREDHDGIKIVGLTEQPVQSALETFQALELGSLSRTTASTAMNARSSRSHAIFTVSLERRSLNNANDLTRAKFHLVDLAGSERANKTGALGERFKEGVNINRGLLALGNVISALCDDASHVPYRDSKLTRLLQDSLGGNSHTIMIACVSPADSNFDETVNTLRYADRARKIKNKPIVNRDPQQAELMRLREQLHQLQLQVMQSPSIQNITLSNGRVQKCEDDIKLLLERNKSLEIENQKLGKELQHSLDHITELCEKRLTLEITNEQLLQILAELEDNTNKEIERLENLQEDNPLRQEFLQSFREMKTKIVSIQCKQIKKEEEFSTYSPNRKPQKDNSMKEELSPSVCQDDLQGEDCDNMDESMRLKSTLKQAAMNRELQELDQALAQKEELALKMRESGSRMDVMRIHFESSLKQMEDEITNLQKEKEELMNALRAVQASNNASKISEQRRKRLQELEAQITGMKKQIQEKSKLLKLKQEAERKVTVLQQEIQSMKSARVKLMRQIKEEADKYRTLKLEKDREVASLKQKDRKRQFEMTKLQREFDKQKNVLKRKMEEASAANKRLNDALQQQKKVAERRAKEKQQSIQGIGTRVQQWLTQEMEVVLRSKEAKHHLEILIEDRKVIKEQINVRKKNLEAAEPPEKKMSFGSSGEDTPVKNSEEEEEQIRTLQQEFELRNAQISDLQQKILDVDQDEKIKHRWDTVHNIVEAKCAMKWLFETAVASKLELFLEESKHSSQLESLESQLEAYKAEIQTLNDDKGKLTKHIQDLKHRHQQKITDLVREHEDKVIYLLQQQLSSTCGQSSSLENCPELMEKLEFMEKEINRLTYLNDELKKEAEENKDLREKLVHALKTGEKPNLLSDLNISDHGKFNETITLKKGNHSMMETFLEETGREFLEVAGKDECLEESEDDFNEYAESSCVLTDDENDPDWRNTPLHKRRDKFLLSKFRKVAYKSEDSGDNSTCNQSKKSTSASGCSCKISCATRRCGCARHLKACTELCKCNAKACCNRVYSDNSDDGEKSSSDNSMEMKTSSDPPKPGRSVLSEINIGDSFEKFDKNQSGDFVLPPKSKKYKYQDQDSINIINESGIKKHIFKQRSKKFFAPVPH